MSDVEWARAALLSAWPTIVAEARQVLASELHYQAMIYHALRTAGSVPLRQIGMNVKQNIRPVTTTLFKAFNSRKNPDYQSDDFEPIPDVVLFRPDISGDWRRRNNRATLLHMVMAIEVKASERDKTRLNPKSIIDDIAKLAAQREEVKGLGSDFCPVVMVIDTAPLQNERMSSIGLQNAIAAAERAEVEFYYVSCTDEIVRPPAQLVSNNDKSLQD